MKRLSFYYIYNNFEIPMTGLLIKDFPPELHQRLKEAAARSHRSMTRQALVLLEQALSAPSQNTASLLPEPLKPATTLASGNVVAVIRENRDADQFNLSQ
jgi:plasmid stability protein